MEKGVLFTGITGQMGRAIAERIPIKGINASYILHKDAGSYDMDLGSTKVICADISDREALFKHVKDLKSKVSVLVHMAAVGHGHPEDEIRDTVFTGAINLYEFAKEIGCERYIFLSSILAAGWLPRGIPYIDESFNPHKKSLCFFGKMKLQAEEELLRMAGRGIPKVVILRLGNVYGPPTKLSFVRYVADIILKKKKMLYRRAKDSVMWAPIYIQDVIDCIFLLLEKPLFKNNIYFLTGSEQPELHDIARLVSDALHTPMTGLELGFTEKILYRFWQALDTARGFIGRPSFPDFKYSNKKIEADIGFAPKVKLDEGIRRTIEWGLSQGAFSI